MHHDVIMGKAQRRTIHLVLLDSDGSEKWRWSFEKAYPVKWIGPDLKSDASAIALESLEIAHNGFSK